MNHKILTIFVAMALSISLAVASTTIVGSQITTELVNAVNINVDKISNSVQGFLNFNNNRLVNVKDPVDEQDAVTKKYVDGLIEDYVEGGGPVGGGFGVSDIGDVLILSDEKGLLIGKGYQNGPKGVIEGENKVYYFSEVCVGTKCKVEMAVFDKNSQRIVDRETLYDGTAGLWYGGKFTGGEINGVLYFYYEGHRNSERKFYRYDGSFTELEGLPGLFSNAVNYPSRFIAINGNDIYGFSLDSFRQFSAYKYNFEGDSWENYSTNSFETGSSSTSLLPRLGNENIQVFEGKVYWPGLSVGRIQVMKYDLESREVEQIATDLSGYGGSGWGYVNLFVLDENRILVTSSWNLNGWGFGKGIVDFSDGSVTKYGRNEYDLENFEVIWGSIGSEYDGKYYYEINPIAENRAGLHRNPSYVLERIEFNKYSVENGLELEDKTILNFGHISVLFIELGTILSGDGIAYSSITGSDASYRVALIRYR